MQFLIAAGEQSVSLMTKQTSSICACLWPVGAIYLPRGQKDSAYSSQDWRVRMQVTFKMFFCECRLLCPCLGCMSSSSYSMNFPAHLRLYQAQLLEEHFWGTVNREIFAVKIFSLSVLATKIKHAKIKRIALMYTVRGRRQRKFFYTKIYSTKYF